MNNVFKDFLDAAEELDDLALEGFYGEDIKKLTKKKDSINTNAYLAEALDLWIGDTEQFGKEKVKEYILAFFDLYTESLKVDGQKTVDTLSLFWMGTPDNPELECLSAYSEFGRLFTETKHSLKDIESKDEIKLSDRKRLAASMINSYSKGVEFIGKVLTVCIILKKISNNESYNLMKIYGMSIFEKVNIFESITNKKYKKLTDIVNRSLRNADSHLSLRFDYKENVLLLKKKKDGKIVNDKVTIQQMIIAIFPSVGWFTQAFIYSGILFVFSLSDKEKFSKYVYKIYGLTLKDNQNTL
ncbi:hypothetical protein POL82_27080 (plasmid) [Priestia aryabhattai]|uniref:hypothetical protein n=1 Tax=Priestia aryabhattai TaxID=412384 RepID=UPI00234EE97D|nr:hypothetical protein [Priestia aryabhattai]MDC7767149.1 hypothetical protein [Priestia aryabhattai]